MLRRRQIGEFESDSRPTPVQIPLQFVDGSTPK